jgi:diguanylate cyclase (GGDEF)-like protein
MPRPLGIRLAHLQTDVKRIPSLIAPALLLPAAAAVTMTHRLPTSVATAVDAAPLLVFGSGALLGLLTRRARLLVAVVILALADCALANVGSRTVFDAVALLLPVNIAVVVWLGDENPLAGRGALLFAITLLQAAIIAVLLNPGLASVTDSLDMPLVSARMGMWTALPRLSVLLFAVALGIVVARFFLHGQSLAAGAAWALVASFLALDGVTSGGPIGVHFAAAGLLLLASATREPRAVVATDDITRLPTRIEFQKALRRLTKRYAVAYVEVDDFPSFRAQHGTEAVHRMLRSVAKRLQRMGGGGHAYYCDGPTFAVLFPGASAKRAMQYLDAVRVVIEDVTVEVSVTEPASSPGKPGRVVERTVSVTISAGVAEAAAASADPKQVTEAADRALARAKQAGMNRVSR